MKHTPGPWLIDDQSDETVFVAETEKHFIFGPYTKLNNKSEQELDLANARLIAVAPEMLEALEAAWTLLSEYRFSGPVSTMVNAAIKKARGEK